MSVTFHSLNHHLYVVQSSDSNENTAPHHEPEGECIFCCEELTKDNYVEYRAVKGGDWLSSVYCQECIQIHFIEAQVS